jgi:hypothetical protein
VADSVRRVAEAVPVMLFRVPLQRPLPVFIVALNVRVPTYCASATTLLNVPLKDPVQSFAAFAFGFILSVPLTEVPDCVTVAVIGHVIRRPDVRSVHAYVPVKLPARLICVRVIVRFTVRALVSVTR